MITSDRQSGSDPRSLTLTLPNLNLTIFPCLVLGRRSEPIIILLSFVHFQVIDVSHSVHELYSKLDPVSLEVLVTEVIHLRSTSCSNT